jgi:predicted aspartyl protease
MSVFQINLVVCNPSQWELTSLPMTVLVNTGSELTWLPAEMLRSIGVEACHKRAVKTANNETVERKVGYAILRANGCETADEVVFGEPGDAPLLGTRALEGFGVMMDDMARRFVSLTTMVAFSARHLPDPLTRAA